MPSRRSVLISVAAVFLVGEARAQEQSPSGVRRVRGAAMINGQPATPGVTVRAGDRITTGPDAELVFVVGRDAMMLRQNASLEILKNGFRLATGAALSVFEPQQRKELRTATATIGIRGTAVYLEVQPQRTYACTCYGEAVLEPADEPAAGETVRTRRHERPRYIAARGAPKMLAAAPVVNHTDAELKYLEGLVGRMPAPAPRK